MEKRIKRNLFQQEAIFVRERLFELINMALELGF